MAAIATNPVRQRFEEAVATMSARDRRLLVGLVIFVMTAMLGGTWWFARTLLGDVRSRIDDREHTLSLLEGLADDEKSNAAQVQRIEEELRRNAGQDLPAFVEKSAEKVGIKANLQSQREKEVSTRGNLEEKTYAVELQKVPVQGLTDFLYEIESGGYPLRVRSMKTKTVTVSGAKVLNVTLEISAFRLVEEAAAEAPAGEEVKEP
ncbi:MAG: hypothetical protein ACOZNI_29940 [Myxococcota bacterium]